MRHVVIVILICCNCIFLSGCGITANRELSPVFVLSRIDNNDINYVNVIHNKERKFFVDNLLNYYVRNQAIYNNEYIRVNCANLDPDNDYGELLLIKIDNYAPDYLSGRFSDNMYASYSAIIERDAIKDLFSSYDIIYRYNHFDLCNIPRDGGNPSNSVYIHIEPDGSLTIKNEQEANTSI